MVFLSEADNLVISDTNGVTDVFIFDRLTRQTERVSVNSEGEQADGASSRACLSPDGRYVAFFSLASNLDPLTPDDNTFEDVYLHDRHTGSTERISISTSGEQGDHEASLYRPAISADGCLIVFHSSATNLVPGDTNLVRDVFLRNRCANGGTGETTLLSRGLSGAPANGDSDYAAITPNGRYVAFTSLANNLVVSDTNGFADVFLLDRQQDTIKLISLAFSGQPTNGDSDRPAMSDDARWIAFFSEASDLVLGDTNEAADIFLHDRQSGLTRRVSVGSGGAQPDLSSDTPTISDDGRFVAFYSYATNLVPDDTNNLPDVFVHDTQQNTTTLVSVAFDGTQGNAASFCSALSGSGDLVAFYSQASNLVAGDTNNQSDVFISMWRTLFYYVYLPLVSP